MLLAGLPVHLSWDRVARNSALDLVLVNRSRINSVASVVFWVFEATRFAIRRSSQICCRVVSSISSSS